MHIDESGVWHCDDCHVEGNYNDVSRHEKAVELAKKYFKGKLMGNQE